MSRPPSLQPSDAAMKLRGMITGYFVSRALYVAAELGIAGKLAAGQRSVEELAQETGTHAPTLYRVLRALASNGLFREADGRRFENTELSNLLRDDIPGSQRGVIRLFGHETSWRSWEQLLHSVRTGVPGFEHVYGEEFFPWVSGHQDFASIFDQAMIDVSGMANASLVEAYDFNAFRTVVDVAGGVGSTLCAILAANSLPHGILFDMAHLEERARAFIAEKGLAARCRFVAGSFFDGVPPGHDAYFMKHILHDWYDEDCVKILRSCRAAIPAHGKLLVCERMVRPPNEPCPAKWSDLHMLLTTHGGRERTEAEHRELLGAGGFQIKRVVPTASPWSVIEAVPA